MPPRASVCFQREPRFVLRAKWANSREENKREDHICQYRIARSHRYVTVFGNNNHIAGLKKNILLCKVSLNNLLVIEWMLHLFPVLCSKYVDILDLCKLREAARAGKRLQDSHVRQERESAGMGDFTGNVNAAAVYFGHRHRHLRTGEIFGKALAQRPRELH